MANQETKVKLVAEISASSNGLISALKQASGAINDSTQNWSSKFSQLKDSTSLISQSVKNLGDVISKVDSADDFAHLSSSLNEVQTVFQKVQAEVTTFAQQMSSLKNSASDLGMSVQEYQAFGEAVKQAGMSMEQGEQMIRSMQERILALANGVPEAQAQFEQLGLTIEKLSSNTVMGNFSEIASAINTTIPATERASQSMDIFRNSVDQATKVGDKYNQLMLNGTGSFVSDKDVQSSISLCSAIEKLGDQLGKYTVEIKNSERTLNDYIERTVELMDLEKMEERLRDNLIKAVENYNSSLESVKNKTATVGDAYKKLAKDIQGAKEAIEKNDDEQNMMLLDSGNLDTITTQIDNLYDKLLAEVAVVQDIMALRNNAGAPVDTKEMDDAIDRVHQLTTSIDGLSDVFSDLGDTGNVEFLADLRSMVDGLEEALTDLKRDANAMNFDLGMDEATAQLGALMTKFEEAKQNLEKGTRVSFDTKELEELIDKLDNLGKIAPLNSEAVRQLSVAKTWAGELKNNIAKYNKEIAKGYPLWQPIINAVNRVKEGFRHLARSGGTIGDKLRLCWQYMTHFKNATNQAGASVSMASAEVGKMFLQVAGLGSPMAVIALAWKNVSELIREASENLREYIEEMNFLNIANGADDQWKQLEKNSQKQNKLIEKLKSFAELYDAEQTSKSEEARAKRINAQEELKKMYGFEFNETNGAIENLDEQIAKQLEKVRSRQLKDIDAMMKKNNKVVEDTSRYIERFGAGFVGYLNRYVATQFFFDINANRTVGRAQERRSKAKERNAELMERRREIEGATPEQWMRVRQGKAQDAGDKAVGELLKRIHDAEAKLRDWANSLGDTEHLKNLRAIMAKYEEAVKGGVKEEEARKVAIEAIADLMVKEKEKEKELIKAMQQRVQQCNDAVKAYAEAQKAVIDAQKEYARTQRDLANENRAERISKRRERLAKRMGSFGFQPFEGFKTDEKPSARRERRRNAQIDASIAEKMGKAQAGGRVHWTPAEKERLAQFERLQKKDKQLEAAQKQMDAAQKQEQAARQLQDAAKAIQNANKSAGETYKNMGKAVGDMLANSLPKLKTRSKYRKEAGEIFDDAEWMLKGMEPPTAKGIDTNMSQQVNYSGQLDTIHKDLQDLNKRIYIVK